MQTKLRRHQCAALDYLADHPRALIDLQMGSGKSCVLVRYVLDTPGIKRVLIVCPRAFVGGWEGQFEKHGDRPVVFARLDETAGSVTAKMELAKCALNDAKARDLVAVVCINYESAWRTPFGDWALIAGFDVVACDEVQALRTNSKVSRYFARLGRTVGVAIGLSGTPFPESPLDTYGVCRFIDPSLFGTNYNAFKYRYAVFGGFNNYVCKGYINQAEMRSKIDLIRFTATPEGYDLPAVTHVEVPLRLPQEAMRVYTRLARDLYAKVESKVISAANAAVCLVRLQQLTSGYLPVEEAEDQEGSTTNEVMHTVKGAALADILNGLPRTEPVVVFCRFHYDLTTVHDVAKACGRQSAELSGRPGHPAVTLDRGVWKGPETVLAVQGRSGVEGVDFTSAAYAVFYSTVWELGKYQQAVARLVRQNQTRPCTFYHLVCTGLVDQKIQRALQAKKDVLEALLTDGQ